MNNQPTVSIIILSWNGENFLKPCIEAVLEQAELIQAEVIVVDNASTDSSVEIIKSYIPRVQLIQNAYNLGFAGGNNVGLSATKAQISILLNQDTIVQHGWLIAIISTFSDSTIGIVGCKALYPDGKTIQHASAYLDKPSAYPNHIGMGEIDDGAFDSLSDAEYVTGAAFAISRNVIQKVGQLDELYYPAFYEEVDYCYRARRAGFRVLYQPQAVIIHFESTSLRQSQGRRAWAMHRNRLRFLLINWTDDQLRQWWLTEHQKVDEVQDPVILETLSLVYFESALILPQVNKLRKTTAYSAGEIQKNTQKMTLEKLLVLAGEAHQKSLTWIGLPSEARIADALRSDFLDTPLSSSKESLVKPWDFLSKLSDKAGVEIYAPRFSKTPIFGNVVAHFKLFVFNHIVQPYLVFQFGKLAQSFDYLLAKSIYVESYSLLLQKKIELLQTQNEARAKAIAGAMYSILELDTRE